MPPHRDHNLVIAAAAAAAAATNPDGKNTASSEQLPFSCVFSPFQDRQAVGADHALGHPHDTAVSQHRHTPAPVASVRALCGGRSVFTDCQATVGSRDTRCAACRCELAAACAVRLLLCAICSCCVSTVTQAECEQQIQHRDEGSGISLGGKSYEELTKHEEKARFLLLQSIFASFSFKLTATSAFGVKFPKTCFQNTVAQTLNFPE